MNCHTGQPTAGNLTNLFKSNKSSPLAAIYDIYKIGVTPIGGNSYERKTYNFHIMNHKYIRAFL